MTAKITERSVALPKSYDAIAWKWMRLSAFLLIPLVWGHVILQDIIVGVFAMDANYVAMRWASLFWRVYDALLLGFAFAHGVNGIRQVLFDFVKGENNIEKAYTKVKETSLFADATDC